MPIDKQPKGPANKPITPALSSRFRNTKTAVAPRLAGSAPTSPAVSSKRDIREQTLSPPTEQNHAHPLSGNITPRSGARSTRISTESPASPATARRLSGNGSIMEALNSARPTSIISSPGSIATGQGRPGMKSNSPNTSATRRTSGSSSVSRRDEPTSKFFRANEAKPASTFQPSKSTLSPRPVPSSFAKSSSPRIANLASPPSSRRAHDDQKDHNFVRANDVNVRPGRSPVATRKPSITSMISMNTTKPRSPDLWRTQSHVQLRSQSTHQASPSKSLSTPVHKPISSTKPKAPEPTSTTDSPIGSGERRPSFGSSISTFYPVRPMLHRKSASISSFGPPPKVMGSPPKPATHHIGISWIAPSVTIPAQHQMMASSPDTLSPRSASLASSKTMGTSVTSDTDISEVSKNGSLYPITAHSDVTSPLVSHQQPQTTPLAQAQINAANARRERKVLDLEISNSSLLAINKTLEKELRKQSAELRRFRRLSRSGRLSFAPSNRSVSAQSAMSLDTLQEQSEDGSDFSDEEDEEEESDFEELDDEIDDPLRNSLDANTARARKRARDERRLMLDLSKHQQLLVDSQKLTQSIRKCVNISEDLIKEANQALKYKVGIGDVKLGGRVLSAEDFDIDHDTERPLPEQNAPRRGLLSPSIAQTELHEAGILLGKHQGIEDLMNRYMSDSHGPS